MVLHCCISLSSYHHHHYQSWNPLQYTRDEIIESENIYFVYTVVDLSLSLTNFLESWHKILVIIHKDYATELNKREHLIVSKNLYNQILIAQSYSSSWSGCYQSCCRYPKLGQTFTSLVATTSKISSQDHNMTRDMTNRQNLLHSRPILRSTSSQIHRSDVSWWKWGFPAQHTHQGQLYLGFNHLFLVHFRLSCIMHFFRNLDRYTHLFWNGLQFFFAKYLTLDYF